MAITVPLGVAAIGVGGSMLAANSQASGARDAANISANATTNATNAQMSMYNQTRSDLSPFVTGGQNAFSQLQSFLSPGGPISSLLGLGGQDPTAALRSTPGYQFAFDQGNQALDRSAASRGLLLSGGQLKDSQTYGQGMADQLYGTRLNQLGTYATQLSGVAGTGENAAAMTGTAGTAATGQIGQSLLQGANQQGMAVQNAGTANASGYAGAANNIGTLLNNSSIQALFQPSTPTYTGDGNGEFYGLSDRRAKTDIRKIGRAESGLNIYSYRLKGDVRTQMGVMSDEVRRVAPDAVRRASDGYDRVDYAKVSRLPPMKRAA